MKEIILALISAGVPTTIIGLYAKGIHRQTKPSNGKSLAKIVEQTATNVNQLGDKVNTLTSDVASLAWHMGEHERTTRH